MIVLTNLSNGIKIYYMSGANTKLSYPKIFKSEVESRWIVSNFQPHWFAATLGKDKRMGWIKERIQTLDAKNFESITSKGPKVAKLQGT